MENNSQVVQVKIKSVYGNELCYPANVTAENFAKLTGTKTFSQYHLNYIMALGYKIVQVNAYDLGGAK